MIRIGSMIVALALFAGGQVAYGLQRTYVVHMSGPQEIPGPGDADGIADGTITLDDATGMVSWNFTYANIAAPTLMHIHTGAAGVSGGILINLGVATSGGAGTLISSTVHGNLAQVTSVLTNPQGFYVNIHNAPFGAGAVRGQVGCDSNADCDPLACETCNLATSECVADCPAVTGYGAVLMFALIAGGGVAIFRKRKAGATT